MFAILATFCLVKSFAVAETTVFAQGVAKELADRSQEFWGIIFLVAICGTAISSVIALVVWSSILIQKIRRH